MSQPVTFIVAFAAVFGAAEAIRETQSQARRKEHRSRKNNLVVHCLKSSRYSATLEGRHIVLSGDKLYIDTGTEHNVPFGHPFAGYYLPYPDTQYSGLVSSICDDPPVMNWIYVDRDTYELKFGTRAWAEHNFKGPWDCTRQDRRLTLGSWEGFVAVKEGDFWALYFDLDDDGLKDKVPEGTVVIDVVLTRIEMRVPKPIPKEQQQQQEQGQQQQQQHSDQQQQENQQQEQQQTNNGEDANANANVAPSSGSGNGTGGGGVDDNRDMGTQDAGKDAGAGQDVDLESPEVD